MTNFKQSKIIILLFFGFLLSIVLFRWQSPKKIDRQEHQSSLSASSSSFTNSTQVDGKTALSDSLKKDEEKPSEYEFYLNTPAKHGMLFKGKAELSSYYQWILNYESFQPNFTKDCSNWGGLGKIQKLRESKTSLCVSKSASSLTQEEEIVLTSAIDLYTEETHQVLVLTNASVVLTKDFQKPKKDRIEILINECDSAFDYHNLMKDLANNEREGPLIQKIRPRRGESQGCSNAKTVLLVLSSDNFSNWWWFFANTVNIYKAMAALAPEILGEGEYKILFTSGFSDKEKKRYLSAGDFVKDAKLKDLIVALFSSSNRIVSSAQHNPEHSLGCYSKIVFMREKVDSIFMNQPHPFDHCYSPLAHAFLNHLRAKIGLYPQSEHRLLSAGHTNNDNKNNNIKTKVKACWIGRTEDIKHLNIWQKQRVVKNQATLVDRLNEDNGIIENNIEVELLSFYEPKFRYSAVEQLHLVSRCRLVFGMHGAGLYSAFAMFQPAVLEFVKIGISNENVNNLMTMIGGSCKLQRTRVEMNDDNTLKDIRVVARRVVEAMKQCNLL